jgi:hypothetical protein
LYERKKTVQNVRWSTHFLQLAPYKMYGGRWKYWQGAEEILLLIFV